MSNLISQSGIEKVENVLINGDLSTLSADERVTYYKNLCESLSLNPLTKPFDYIKFQGKLTLYARKDCTEQLRAKHGISIKISAREKFDDVYVVTAQAQHKDGRYDESTGAVNIKGLSGDALANAYMKAETKAKRRVTLSISGLGLMDENEVETIPGGKFIDIDLETGELVEEKKILKKELPSLNDKRLNMIKMLDIYKEEGDVINVREYWFQCDKEDREAIQPHMNKELKQWVRKIVTAPEPIDYIGV